jgi:hypothetical protein
MPRRNGQNAVVLRVSVTEPTTLTGNIAWDVLKINEGL